MLLIRMLRTGAWILIALGLAFLAWGGWLLESAVSSSSWPTTEGRVLSAEVIATTTHGVGEGRYHRREWTRVSLSPSVRYSYSVDGAEYENSLVSFAPEIRDPKALVDELRSASSVLVHYDPSVPGRSVLRTGAAIEHAIPFALAGVLLALALSWLWFARKISPPASPQS